MYYISNRQRIKPMTRCQASEKGPEFSDSLLHSLSSGLWAQTDSLGCPFLFLLSFLSGHPEKYRPTAVFFLFWLFWNIINSEPIYFSNTLNISQCDAPTNWSTGINCFILYPPFSKIFMSRTKLFGLHDT